MGKELTAGQLRATGIGEQEAADVLERVNPLLGSLPPARCWVAVTRDVLTPQLPFALHRLLHEVVFSDWDPSAGPAPAWFPPEGYVEESNIGRLMRELGFDSYRRFHAWSARHRADFWRLMVDRVGIRFMRRCQRLVDLSGGVESPMWFPGATLNIADSCFGTCDDTPAIVFQPEGGELGRVSSKELLSHTNRAANGLRAAGLVPGDGVAIDMPMTVEAVAIYLAIVKAGCVAVSIADSFAPQEIAKRLRLGRAKAVFTQDIILRAGKRLPLYERVVAAGAPKTIVLPGEAVAPGSIPSIDVELRDTDVRWLDFLSDSDKFDPWPAQPGDHTNILFSSGTTGEPKAIPWTHTTPMKSAVDGYLHHDIRPGDVVAWPTNLGWMMGPWLIYASLVNRATIALYYGAPTGREFGVFVQNAGVTTLGVVPSLVRTWRHSGCMAGLDWGAIRVLSSTGECSNAEDMLFLMSLAGYRPIIEYCGGTEIGGGHITGTVVQPSAPATFSTAALGLDLVVLDEQGGETRNGELFLIPPAIGMSTELLNRDPHEVYFEGTPTCPPGKEGSLPFLDDDGHGIPLRRHGDQVECLGGGYYRMHGRVDDTMNLGGIKTSAADIEQTLGRLGPIREVAAVAVPSPGGGPSRLVVYAVLSPGVTPGKEELQRTLQQAIKSELNPLFRLHDVVIVESLLRTASNKVMRRVLRDRYAATPRS